MADYPAKVVLEGSVLASLNGTCSQTVPAGQTCNFARRHSKQVLRGLEG